MLGRTQILRIPFVVACLFLQVNSGGCDAPTHIEPIEAPLPTTKGLPHTPQQGPWLSTKIRRDFDRNVGFKSAGRGGNKGTQLIVFVAFPVNAACA
jgi:hypothetical protein